MEVPFAYSRAAALVLLLSGCSEVVTWEEEVVLNTGQTVVVRREVRYERGGSPGNPLKIAWNAQRGSSRLSFEWKGRTHVFQEHAAPLLLAISTEDLPVLVANAAIGAWDERHNYVCTTPHYVQFVPDATGSHWTWPNAISRWLYGMKANLLKAKPTPDSDRRRFTVADVRSANEGLALDRYQVIIDREYIPSHCQPKRPTR